MATHSSIFAWKIPWTEETGGLPYMGSQRVGHDWACTHTHTHTTQAVITEIAGICQASHSRGFLAPNILSSVLGINLLLLQQQYLYRMFPPRPMPPPLPVPPKTLLLFSLFSFLNNTISVLVQSFKKLGLDLVFKSFWLLLFSAVYFPKGSDHSLEHLAYSVEL